MSKEIMDAIAAIRDDIENMQKRVDAMETRRADAGWNENAHPRDGDGKFGSGSGSGSKRKKSTETEAEYDRRKTSEALSSILAPYTPRNGK